MKRPLQFWFASNSNWTASGTQPGLGIFYYIKLVYTHTNTARQYIRKYVYLFIEKKMLCFLFLSFILQAVKQNEWKKEE